MAWTKYQIFLACMMVVTGSINTLSTKWADEMDAEGRDGVSRKFEHPFLQACAMFLGEVLCLITFKIVYFYFSRKRDGSEEVHSLTKGNRDFNSFILFIPAMCDMIGTSLMYIGLTLTYASSFQMFRGAVIIFVGLLSVAFLNRRLQLREWIGIAFIIVGLALVGLADMLNTDTNSGSHSKNDIITGDLLIIAAQVITAIQMVVEEKFVAGQDIPPLQAVGWEGSFGLVVLGLLLIPFYYIKVGPPFSNNSRGVLEDAIEGFVQIGNNPAIGGFLCGTIISIAFFNFAGISVTKEMSATTRMVLDSVRTLVIWVVSLAFMGQQFHYLQLLGFIALLIGMCLYNNITFKSTFLMLRLKLSNARHSRNHEELIENKTADQPDDANVAIP